MPATSIRDLVIHDDDLVVGTHGRSFWILDDITPLRQIHAEMATRFQLLEKREPKSQGNSVPFFVISASPFKYLDNRLVEVKQARTKVRERWGICCRL